MMAVGDDAEEAFDDEVVRCHVSCARDRWDCRRHGVGDGLRGCTYCDSILDEEAEGQQYCMVRQYREYEDGGGGWDCGQCHYRDGHCIDNHLPMASCALVRWVWRTMGHYSACGEEYSFHWCHWHSFLGHGVHRCNTMVAAT